MNFKTTYRGGDKIENSNCPINYKNMKVTKLAISNYRDIDLFKNDFHPRLNIVETGWQPTIIDSIAMMLSWVINKIKAVNREGQCLSEKDIKEYQKASAIDITCQDDELTINWSLKRSQKSSNILIRNNLSNLTKYTKYIRSQITKENEFGYLPTLVYYPNRQFPKISLNPLKKDYFHPIDVYDNALNITDFHEFFQWFRTREDLENENRSYVDTTSYLGDFQLNVVRQALHQFLPEITDIRVRRNPLKMEVTKDHRIYNIEHIFLEEQYLIALIGDLAKRLAIANPISLNPLEGKGIVLIEEIELYLATEWQQKIIPKLLEVFPNCQFIASTYIPVEIIDSIKNDDFYLFDNDNYRR